MEAQAKQRAIPIRGMEQPIQQAVCMHTQRSMQEAV